MDSPTEKTRVLTDRWLRAKNAVVRLKREINHAECEEVNAANELGKWLVPEGQNDEPFNIWFGSGIIQAMRAKNGDYKIAWRKEPDGKDRIEYGVLTIEYDSTRTPPARL